MSDDKFGYSQNQGYQTNQSANVTFGTTPQSEAPVSQNASIKDISTAEFMSEVIEASRTTPVLVDFWAPWCGPCKQLAPALEAAVSATNGKVKLVKMDIDKHPEIPGQMGIQSIPAVVAFVDGKPADAFMGAKPESEIREFIGKIAGSSNADDNIDNILEKAAEYTEQGALAEAANIYGQLLNQDPQNLKVISAFGHLYLQDGSLEGAMALLKSLPEEKQQDNILASLRSAIELAEQAKSVGDFAELEAAIEANPDDYQSRFDLAIAMNGAGKREEAADHLLVIIQKKPDWNEEAARNQLLQFFEAWGMTDETTLASRRKLSSLLFS